MWGAGVEPRDKVKSINQYRLTPGFGGFTPVSYETTECRLPCRSRGIRTIKPALNVFAKV
ncbi:TPA: hypothetical protein ACWXNI_004922 [Escherichia coli]|nr:hypothetical protein [Escherichia coli]EEX3426533.1 hypothetical protein [Escherichia coli]ELL7149435.1 hypothetical protein [Escherichia coli]